MTNDTLPDPGTSVSPELLALAPFRGTRRPVKVVEHPAFRPHRAAATAASLRRGAGSTIATTSREAA